MEHRPRVSYENLLSRIRAGAAVLPEAEEDVTVVLETTGAHEESSAVHAPGIHPLTKTNLYQHPLAHPLALTLGVIYQYGPECLLWEPETLRFFTQDELGPMSDLNSHKIQACISMLRNNAFWNRWEVFTVCTMPLNDIPPDFEVQQVPTVADILVSVEIAKALRDDVEFNSEVRTFMEKVYLFDGLFVHLAPVTFVSLPSKDLPFNDLLVHNMWPKVRASKVVPSTLGLGEQDQLNRMLLAYNHLEQSRARLKTQLPLVTHELWNEIPAE